MAIPGVSAAMVASCGTGEALGATDSYSLVYRLANAMLQIESDIMLSTL